MDSPTDATNLLQFKQKKGKYSGGRYLSALELLEGPTHLEYRILTKFGSELNFNGNFNEWRYVFLDRYAVRFKSTPPSISRAFKNLIKLGFMESRKATKEEWPENHDKAPNFFRFTEKLLSLLNDFSENDLPEKQVADYQNGNSRVTKMVNLAPSIKAPSIKAPTVCVEQKPEQPKNTHTHFENNKTEKPKDRDKSIPVSACIPLANYIQIKKCAKNFDNKQAESIITAVMAATNCTLEEFSKAFRDFESLESKPQYFCLRKWTDEEVTKACINLMTPKEQIQAIEKEKPDLSSDEKPTEHWRLSVKRFLSQKGSEK